MPGSMRRATFIATRAPAAKSPITAAPSRYCTTPIRAMPCPFVKRVSKCVPVADDGSRTFAKIYDAVQDGGTVRRVEKKRKKA